MATQSCPSSRPSKNRRQVGKPPPSVMNIDKLGDDPLLEILIRLPNIRSASRCKTVCNRWRSLISSPRFNRRFVSHHQQQWIDQPPMPDNPDELQPIIVSILPPMPDAVADTFRILDCFKDLVLCGFWDLDSDNKEPGRSFLVCNPFTKEWLALPLAPERAMGYIAQVARFVFEPRISYDLDLGEEGDAQQKMVCSEYRFRVVCIYQHDKSIKLDWFCSESGKWTKEALVLDRKMRINRNVISCNGELFWGYCETEGPTAARVRPWVAAFNPFRPDVPPTTIDACSFFGYVWDISASQGALHVIKHGPNNQLVVWRLKEDRKSWSKQYEDIKQLYHNLEPDYCFRPFLHPHIPGIIFFHYFAEVSDKRVILSFDLGTGEQGEFTKYGKRSPRIAVFQPMVSCLPTPIPRYEELRGMYDGSYSFWVQSSSTATTPSITAEQCQPVEGVEQFCNWKDNDGSAPNPWHHVKKQKVVDGSCSKPYDAIGRKICEVKEGALINCRRSRRWDLFN